MMKKMISFAVSCSILMVFISGCSKKLGPTPDETRLLQEGDDGALASGSGGDESTGAGRHIPGALLSEEDGDILQSQRAIDYDPTTMKRGMFQPVYFGFDQYAVDPKERDNLNEVAAFLNREKDARLIIEGHCDWKGTPEYNQSLGDRRATNVKQYLIDLAIDPSRIDIVSMGDSKSVVGGDASQMRHDRRAEFVLADGL